MTLSRKQRKVFDKFDTDTSGGVNDDDNFGQTTNVASGISDASFTSSRPPRRS